MRHAARSGFGPLVGLLAALALAGCANPMLDVRGPGYSLADSPSPSREPQSMSEALAKLNHLRAQYHAAIREQSGQELAATQGLVWLGTLIAGMAVADVHRDAFLIAAGVGGTTYGLARTQLDARRALIWGAGMEALDCAKHASLPLDLGKERTDDLMDAAARLREQVGAVQQAQRALTLLSDVEIGNQREAVSLLIQRADDALAAAGRTQAAAAALLQAARGGDLSVTVDRVHTQVTRALRDIAVGLDSIKALIAGLGGFASVLAPGAGVDAVVSKGLADFNTKLTAPKTGANSATQAAVRQVTEPLAQALGRLATAEARLAALTQGVNVAAVSAALKACQVAAIAMPLQLTPASLQFDAAKAASKGFEITGGTPPYMVTTLDVLPDSLALQFAGGLSDTALVKATKDVAEGSFRLRVTDSGATKASRQLELRIGAGSTGSTPPPITQPPEDISAAWKKLADAILTKSPVKGLSGTDVTVVKAEPGVTGVALTIRCAPAAAISGSGFKNRLLSNLSELQALSAQLDTDFTAVTLASPDGTCKLK